MKPPLALLAATVLLAAKPVLAADPCPLAAGTDQPVTVELVVADAEGTLVAGVTLEVDHPEAKVGIEGEGIQVPRTTISDAPSDAVATANDLGHAVRLVVARPGSLPTNQRLLKLHFARCEDAPVVAASDFSCKVTVAADPATNKIKDVGCKVSLP